MSKAFAIKRGSAAFEEVTFSVKGEPSFGAKKVGVNDRGAARRNTNAVEPSEKTQDGKFPSVKLHKKQARSSMPDQIIKQSAADVNNEDTNSQTSGRGSPTTSEKQFQAYSQDVEEQLQDLKEELNETISTLTSNCDVFQQQFNREIDLSRKNLEQQLVDSFIDISKHKLPDVYLRSIPKFGGNELTNALHKTLVNMKRNKEAVINVRFNQEIVDEISKIVEDNIEEVFYDPLDIIHQLITTMKIQMNDVKHHANQLENLLMSFKAENDHLRSEIKHLRRTIDIKTEKENEMVREAKEKELQMDILRDQLERRNKTLDHQRDSFHKELVQVKMLLYDKEKGKTVPNETIPMGNFSTQYLGQRSEPTKQEEEINKMVKDMEESFTREKKALAKNHESQLQAKDLEINTLTNKIIRLQNQLKKLKTALTENH